MKVIEITTDSEYFDCEQCGGNSDSGGTVVIDGVEVFSYEPSASCWGNANYDESDLLFLALEKLGITVTVDGGKPYALTKYNPD